MNCSVYPSKSYSAVMLVAVLAFAAAAAWFFRHRGHPPLIMMVIFALLIGIALVALIHGLISKNKPVVQIDETGVRYHPRWFPLIEWPDIVAVVRRPLTERTPDGIHSYVKDDWRPIQLIVRNPEKYLRRVPSFLRMGLHSPEHPGCARIEITCLGMQPGSGVIHECLQHHLARHGVTL